jgi:glycosyltransferase involved in cell wall biosynthesis
MPTGYGTQSRLLIPRLQSLGHKIAVSCTGGQDSHPSYWNGVPVFGKTPYQFSGEDVVWDHYQAFEADIVFTFMCTWTLEYPQVWRELRTVHMTPVDCEPMSIADYRVIEKTGGTPAAISRFGETQMRARKLDPLYLPHGVDLVTFSPAKDRDAMRDAIGYDGKFIVGFNMMNNDRERKNIDQALRGFAEFHGKHPDTVLALHTVPHLPEGWNLPPFLAHLGITDAVLFSPRYELLCGLIPPQGMADWYGSLDVLINIGNEGFGLPAIEAQACGTPVILGNWSTGPDLAGPGWLVQGEKRWNHKHEADWGYAHTASVVDALEAAYEGAAKLRDDARSFALGHDINRIVREHWEPVLSDLA